MTREEFNNTPIQEKLKALELVKFLVLDSSNISNYYESGDKDTRIIAFNNVLSKYGYPNGIYAYDTLFLDHFESTHSDEINTEFNRIVDSGLKNQEFYDKIIDYLNSQSEFFRGFHIYEKNLSLKIMTCKSCNKEKDTRLGVCFDCADAESIINEGVDMWGKGINGTDKPAKTPMEKLKLLISKGWHFGK